MLLPASKWQMEPAIETTERIEEPPKPKVDTQQMNDRQWRLQLQERFPDIPINLLLDNQKKRWGRRLNFTCGYMPKLWDLKVNNEYWQELRVNNGTFYFYRAFYDDRPQEKLGVSIRLLAMFDNMTPLEPIQCHFWYKNASVPIISPSTQYKLIWVRLWGGWREDQLQPYLITCPIPPEAKEKGAPQAVGLTAEPCDHVRVMLRVRDEQLVEGQSKERFAICVKGMSFPKADLSLRLVEWLEVLRAVGINKVFLYELGVHPNVSRVLRYYVEDGFVDLTKLHLPGPQSNEAHFQYLYLKDKVTPKRQNEVIPYNDCLYRNMHKYEYVGLLDIDEAMIPIRFDSLGELIDYVKEVDGPINTDMRTSICFRNVYFMDDMLHAQHHGTHFEGIPPWMHMMQHVYRSSEYSRIGFYPKCLHRTDRVRTLHNHYPFSCLTGCSALTVERMFGHLQVKFHVFLSCIAMGKLIHIYFNFFQHYRRDCVKDLIKVCVEKYKNNSLVDKSIWRFKKVVIARTVAVLQHLGFVSDNTHLLS